MAMKVIDKYSQVKGVTVYKMNEGQPESFPCVVDAEVTLPQITHPSATIQSMGDMEIPDQTRINSMTTSISCELSIIQSKLLGFGVQEYMLRWAQEKKNPDGTFSLVPFVAYISGIPAEDVGATINVGDVPSGTVSINTFKFRLLENNIEIRYVDKRNGILIINGIDYRNELNNML